MKRAIRAQVYRVVKHRIRVQVYRGRGAQPYRLRIVAGNGEQTYKSSEGYVTRSNALREARKLGIPVEVLL